MIDNINRFIDGYFSAVLKSLDRDTAKWAKLTRLANAVFASFGVFIIALTIRTAGVAEMFVPALQAVIWLSLAFMAVCVVTLWVVVFTRRR